MKKLFTLAAVLVAAMTMNAEVTVPESTWTAPNVPTDGWAGKATPTSTVSDGWTVFAAYELTQSASNLTWIAVANSGSTKVDWVANGQFPASSSYTWKNTGKDGDGNPIDDGPRALTVRDDSSKKGPYSFRVKNVTDIAAYVNSGNNGKRSVYVEVYELNAGAVGATPDKSENTDVKQDAGVVLTISGLDKAKEYVLVVRGTNTGSAGTSDGNSTFMALAFKASTATAIDNTEIDAKVVKTFENGQLVIIKNGVKYNATGAVVK